MSQLPTIVPSSFLRRSLTACTVALLATAAQADGPFNHPALRASAAAAPGWEQARAATPLFIGHPASPRWATVHANGEHPAVLLARRTKPLDPNTFIVQPPATARWTSPAEDAVDVATGPGER